MSKIMEGVANMKAFMRIQALIDQCEADIAEYWKENGPCAICPDRLTIRLDALKEAQALFGRVVAGS